jgi:hypothetical protein
MAFEIWHLASRNLMGSFRTETDALLALCDAVEQHGAGFVTELALAYEDSRGKTRTIASGTALIELLERPLPPRSRRPARAPRPQVSTV